MTGSKSDKGVKKKKVWPQIPGKPSKGTKAVKEKGKGGKPAECLTRKRRDKKGEARDQKRSCSRWVVEGDWEETDLQKKPKLEKRKEVHISKGRVRKKYPKRWKKKNKKGASTRSGEKGRRGGGLNPGQQIGGRTNSLLPDSTLKVGGVGPIYSKTTHTFLIPASWDKTRILTGKNKPGKYKKYDGKDINFARWDGRSINPSEEKGSRGGKTFVGGGVHVSRIKSHWTGETKNLRGGARGRV